MNLQGERLIPASPEATWAALNDPQTLQACITGCESLEQTGDNEYQATMALRIGPVNARFKGRLQLLNIEPISSYTIAFDGQGGVAGFGKGTADVSLKPHDEGTLLGYGAKAQVGGKLAQVGSRLIDSVASKIADDFFAAFEARLAGAATTAAPPAVGAETSSASAPTEPLRDPAAGAPTKLRSESAPELESTSASASASASAPASASASASKPESGSNPESTWASESESAPESQTVPGAAEAASDIGVESGVGIRDVSRPGRGDIPGMARAGRRKSRPWLLWAVLAVLIVLLIVFLSR